MKNGIGFCRALFRQLDRKRKGMSQKTSLLSELQGDDRLSPGTLAYLGQRARNHYYDHVIKRFRASGIRQADLAKRLGKGPDRINRLLSSPGNWTIDTVAELLAGICAEELVPYSTSLLGRPERNHKQSDILDQADDPPTPTGSAKVKVLEYTLQP